jgi:hypothetical protein
VRVTRAQPPASGVEDWRAFLKGTHPTVRIFKTIFGLLGKERFA